MELTGVRRTIQGLMFVAVALAAYLVLFTSSWPGHTLFDCDDGGQSRDLSAGNALSVAVAFAAVVLSGRVIARPTPARVRSSCNGLLILFPLAAYADAVSQPRRGPLVR
mgnify:CR=1 FL=1